ncbi:hypothetical protein QJS10_CPB04g01920 [Acorus calamus]|uniref:Uncharacterized protein n=1 Tax=Acorus calamus TaxID=4465 RepID=A0AAV9F2G6_ACOCL|nr:hypothetical protein QJS10_CPB04g01920 [Acorus calamus]
MGADGVRPCARCTPSCAPARDRAIADLAIARSTFFKKKKRKKSKNKRKKKKTHASLSRSLSVIRKSKPPGDADPLPTPSTSIPRRPPDVPLATPPRPLLQPHRRPPRRPPLATPSTSPAASPSTTASRRSPPLRSPSIKAGDAAKARKKKRAICHIWGIIKQHSFIQ